MHTPRKRWFLCLNPTLSPSVYKRKCEWELSLAESHWPQKLGTCWTGSLSNASPSHVPASTNTRTKQRAHSTRTTQKKNTAVTTEEKTHPYGHTEGEKLCLERDSSHSMASSVCGKNPYSKHVSIPYPGVQLQWEGLHFCTHSHLLHKPKPDANHCFKRTPLNTTKPVAHCKWAVSPNKRAKRIII